jgi:hypothetical protein
MIWTVATHDSDLLILVEDGVVVGSVRQQKNNKMFMASTQRHYLGQYRLLKNAQTAVETKRKVECKAEGKIIL